MTDKAITIRTGTSTDNVLLAEMGARTFYDTFAKDNTPADIAAYLAASFSPAKQADELADPANTFLIAEIEGIPVGYVRLHLSPPSSAITGIQPIEIVRFYSDQQWIGHGVGAALMSACLGFAIQKAVTPSGSTSGNIILGRSLSTANGVSRLSVARLSS